ncbi:MAG: peptidoglycan-binding protein [Acidimicrobiia bacterium]|nr:peptidoglycan-binding protein [Acidimicrobiia bacterium]
MRRTLTILVALGALLYLGTAVAGADEAPPPAEPAATTAAPPTAPAALSLESSTSTPVYGERVEVHGSLQPVTPGEEVVLEIDLGDGAWAPMARAPVDGFGSYTISFDALAAGTLRARSTISGAISANVPFPVTPVVRVKAKPGTAFRTATLRAAITPSTYAGRARAVVRRDGERVARAAGRIRHGRLQLDVPTPGIGTFWVELTLPAASGLASRTVGVKVTARGRTLQAGSTGRDVVGLRARLAELRFHVPAPSTTFGSELYDSVIAFQKAYGLPRTGCRRPRDVAQARPGRRPETALQASVTAHRGRQDAPDPAGRPSGEGRRHPAGLDRRDRQHARGAPRDSAGRRPPPPPGSGRASCTEP